MVDTGLKNKTIVITGASGGIGGACARAFAGEGARLVLQGFQHMEEIDRLKQELSVEVLPVKADLTDETETRRLFSLAGGELGPIDGLIANAGIWPAEARSIADMTLERWNRTIETDLTSVFLCTREFISNLKKRGSSNPSIVIIGSTAAVFGEAGHADYSAAKAGITYGLTRSLKNEIVEVAKRGRVNAVCPGWTMTPMAEEEIAGDSVEEEKLMTRPIKEIADPKDIANAILYLSSSKLAGHVTGEVLTVSGGMEGRVI
ncbi:MAG: SDR family NAD(P)-dependent oxidoreductase [Candidatus Acetothermia bacterium]